MSEGRSVWKLIESFLGSPSDKTDKLDQYNIKLALVTGAGLLAGVLVILLSKGWAVAFGCALASLASGVAIGFLFAIPKTKQAGAPIHTAIGGPGSPDTPDDYRQFVNTNLEDISDWLTKIIVGITLIEIRTILEYFHKAADVFAAGLGNDEPTANLALAEAVMVYFAILGFLSSYLLTRLFLAPGLRIADQVEVAELKKRVNELQQQVSKISPPEP